ncbi:hypothetical protein J4217_02470 [Candidatus Pacearchaeota archaeon]|nr:hypothetical protein [Candidatus Pacearchaeota archaeon]
MLSGFEHSMPLKQQGFTRDAFNVLTYDRLNDIGENQVYSLTSKVSCNDGKTKHIPMMNFHSTSTANIKLALEHICGQRKGAILNSGRFFHYYGDFLLDENEWTNFMAEFLMPNVLISPRYIGHRLHDGYCTLRLTSDERYKPNIPRVIEIL